MEGPEISWIAARSATINWADADRKTMAANYEALAGTRLPLPFKQFFLNILDKAILYTKLIANGEANQVEALNKEIQALKNSLEDYTALATSLDKEADALKAQVQSLIEEKHITDELCYNWEQEAKKRGYPDQATELATGEIVVKPSPLALHILNVCSEMESARIKKTVTAGDILLSLFNYQVVEGPGDYLPRTWNRRELREIQQSLSGGQ